MRYHIDTIPVWDALRTQGECLLCTLRRKTEHTLTDRYLGASVMESDTRIRVNKKGFCSPHHQMLYAQQNRLGHALMMLSRLRQVREQLAPLLNEPPGKNHGGLFGRIMKKPAGEEEQQSGSALSHMGEGCVLCDSLEENIGRYAYTVLHLWKTDANFQKELKQSKGFCLPDTALLMTLGDRHLSGQQRDSLQQTVGQLLQENLQRLDEELEWFTLKFDYRNNDKPWGQSRDALERTIQKLRGWCVGKDPGLDG